jgi:endonuclease YncB( thermonuclease family)
MRAVPINRPRRIFRPGVPRPRGKLLAIVALAGLMVAGGVSLAMLPRGGGGTPAVPNALPPEELKAPPSQVAVVDGGTLRLRDRVVRLSGVEPPLRGQPCGAGQDCGAAATNALAALVREVPVACQVNGSDAMGRPYAVCQASGRELNHAVIAAGWGHADQGQPALKRAEEAARAERRGVWASGQNASW